LRSTSRDRPQAPPPPRTVRIEVDTEQVVLAAMLVSADARRRVLRLLPPDRWQVEVHRAAVTALAELDRRRVAYDPAALKRLFPDVDVDYLGQLQAARPTVPADLQHYVEGVRWDALRAAAVTGPISDLLAAIADPLSDQAKVKALARAVGGTFDAWHDRARVLPPESVHAEMVAELRARAAGHAVYPYGLEGLDGYQDEGARPHHPGGNAGRPRLVPAAKPGKVTIITGCSGSGKSTLACRIALGQARLKRRTLYGAWEMTGPESLELLAVMSLADDGVHVSRTQLLSGEPKEGLEEMIERVSERGREINRFVRFVPNPFLAASGKGGNAENLTLIQHLIEDLGADVFIADLWERCLVDTKPEAVQAALFQQQAMCEATRCHGILLQQQRLKDIEKGLDKRPTREGLKGSSGWVDIGDTILGTYMPSQWKDVPADMTVVDVLKQRYGPWPLSVELEWDPDRAWFGKGVSVPYDQPSEREGPSEIEAFSGGGKKGRGRHHG
jgi:hypothetical protein